MSYFRKQRTDDVFDCVKVYLPKSTIVKLKEKSHDAVIPISRLVAIAVDNELDTENPFNYNLDLPADYTEYMYASEASKVLTFLQKLPTGIALDSIMLCRSDIGVTDRKALLGAVRELFEKKLIEEYIPKRGGFAYAKEYRRIRVVSPDLKKMRKTRYKSIEGERLKNRAIVRDEDVERDED